MKFTKLCEVLVLAAQLTGQTPQGSAVKRGTGVTGLRLCSSLEGKDKPLQTDLRFTLQ